MTEPILSQADTIAMLLERSKRPTRSVPIRTTFVQQGAKGTPMPGPLAALTHARGERSLDLFLLIHAVASGGNYDVTEWAATWARSIGNFDPASGRAAVSRAWKKLEALRLIERSRGDLGRTRITLLREDGYGDQYTTPTGKKADYYFQVPFEYWVDGWHLRLDLPAKVLLLVALSIMTPEFSLPEDHVPKWYGISPDTAFRGLKRLRDAGLVVVARTDHVKTLQSPTGYALRNVYRLKEPFDFERRGLRGRRAETPSLAAVLDLDKEILVPEEVPF